MQISCGHYTVQASLALAHWGAFVCSLSDQAAVSRFLTALPSPRGIEVVRKAIDREARLAELEQSPEFRHPGKLYLAEFVAPDK